MPGLPFISLPAYIHGFGSFAHGKHNLTGLCPGPGCRANAGCVRTLCTRAGISRIRRARILSAPHRCSLCRRFSGCRTLCRRSSITGLIHLRSRHCSHDHNSHNRQHHCCRRSGTSDGSNGSGSSECSGSSGVSNSSDSSDGSGSSNSSDSSGVSTAPDSSYGFTPFSPHKKTSVIYSIYAELF